MPLPHGTYSGYANHGCRCDPCRAAASAYKSKWRAANREKANESSRAYKKAHADKIAKAQKQYRDRNREKIRAKARADRLRDRDGTLAAEAAYREANREALARNFRRWWERNRETHSERVQRWQRANPDARRSSSDRYRARRAGVRGGGPGEAEYRVIVLGDSCSYCGQGASTVDHIDALDAGGDDHWTNYTGACLSCNSGKGTKDLLGYLLHRKSLQCQSVTP